MVTLSVRARNFSGIFGDNQGPSAPVISATTLSSSSIEIGLVTPSSDATGVQRYELERSLDGISGWQVLTTAANFPYASTGLSGSTQYFYRCRAIDTLNNIGSYSAIVNATTSAVVSGITLFNPNLAAATTPQQIFTTSAGENGVNNHDGGFTTLQSVVTRPGGSSKAIRITYPNDEAGTQLQFPNFAPTKTLYVRWYMLLDENWAGNFPVGLKTPRIFTEDNYHLSDFNTYLSSKMIWMKYANGQGFAPDGPQTNPDSLEVWGQCHSINSDDIGAKYPAVPLNNGLVNVRAGYWYSYEMWLVMNTADGINDGVLETRIDGKVMYNNTSCPWVSTARGIPNGIAGFRSMWFGGNCSYSPNSGGWPHPGIDLHRYEDGYLVSTDARWLG